MTPEQTIETAAEHPENVTAMVLDAKYRFKKGVAGEKECYIATEAWSKTRGGWEEITGDQTRPVIPLGYTKIIPDHYTWVE
jgi:hypothetical protein